MLGIHPDRTTDAPSSFAACTGLRPAAHGDFALFPVTSEQAGRVWVSGALARSQSAALFLRLEPDASPAPAISESLY